MRNCSVERYAPRQECGTQVKQNEEESVDGWKVVPLDDQDIILFSVGGGVLVDNEMFQQRVNNGTNKKIVLFGSLD